MEPNDPVPAPEILRRVAPFVERAEVPEAAFAGTSTAATGVCATRSILDTVR